jgi:L-arabinose isomerase
MLEICPSIASGTPSLEVHPLGIGGKADPVRLVFDSRTGPAVNASVVEMGDRYRMIVNVVDVVAPDEPLPRLPVARALWRPRPDLATAAAAWIYAGGAHRDGSRAHQRGSAMPHGRLPTEIRRMTLFVLASTTAMSFDMPFAV